MNQVQIANYALTRLGASVIADLGDQSNPEARLMNQLFEQSAMEVFLTEAWPDLMVRKSAAVVTDGAALTPYDHCYQLPNDLIWLVDILNSETFEAIKHIPSAQYPSITRTPAWEREGRRIYANITPLYIKYVAYPIDFEILSTPLARAVALNLAHSAAQRIGRSEEVQMALFGEYGVKLTQARMAAGLDSRGEWEETMTWGDYR
jgi:hypothetical protein